MTPSVTRAWVLTPLGQVRTPVRVTRKLSGGCVLGYVCIVLLWIAIDAVLLLVKQTIAFAFGRNEERNVMDRAPLILFIVISRHLVRDSRNALLREKSLS